MLFLIHCLQSAAKVNITLRVTGKRQDGYHELRSFFYALPAIESLTIEPDYAHNVKDVISVTGEMIRGRNILEDVLASARKRRGVDPLHIRLHKVIPPGSGLGGGSGNAAALISWLNSLGEEDEQIRGEEAGSDVPFFLNGGKWAFVGGRGEHVESLGVDMPHFHVVVVIPLWGMSTARAFSLLAAEYGGLFPMNEDEAEKERADILSQLRSKRACGLLPNDFCTVLLKEHLEYADIFNAFQECGSLGWGITGSGSAAFGLFIHKDGFSRMIRSCSHMQWIRKILLVE